MTTYETASDHDGDVTGRVKRLAEMLPGELDRQLSQTSLLILPFGTIEWHSYHLPLGLDGIKADAICEGVAGRTGGLLAPSTWWAVGGVPFPYTMRFDLDLIERLTVELFRQVALMGFRVIVALTGHYGLEQTLMVKRAAVTVMRSMPITVLALGEFEVVTDRGYIGDHASQWETSLLWAVRPDLVQLDNVERSAPLDGVIGPDPRDTASQAAGASMLREVIQRLSDMSERLLRDTSPVQRMQYIEAAWAGVRVLDRLLSERAVRPKSQVPPVVTPAYVRYLQAIYTGDYKQAQKHAETRLADLSQ
jgi:creatinine amidohydrolase